VKDRICENKWFWGFFYCTCLTTDFTDLHCLFEIKLEVAFEGLVEGFFILTGIVILGSV